MAAVFGFCEPSKRTEVYDVPPGTSPDAVIEAHNLTTFLYAETREGAEQIALDQTGKLDSY